VGWPSCSPFLSLPIFRFLQSFTMGHRDFGGSAEELDQLPCLEGLTWHLGQSGALAPWKGCRFARLLGLWLRTATEPDSSDLAALQSMQVPSLRHLRLELNDESDSESLRALTHVPWLSQLKALDVFVHSPEGAATLASLELPAVRLTITIPAPLALSHRALLRSSWPKAVLSPVPPQRSISDLEVTDSPHFAPDDFASLAPWEDGDFDEQFGSGVSFKQAEADHLFSLCRHCGSSDTLCIYLGHQETEHQDERFDSIRCEYRCRACGKFTHYVDTREH
jgi:hypothetical protein